MYKKTTLDNGLRVITVPMLNIESISIAIFICTGSRYENDLEAGISHFIEHLLFRGTPTGSTSQNIAEAIEGVGGILNAATGKDLTYYWFKVTNRHFHLALDLLADMLLRTKFESEDIEKERQIITEEINMARDSPPQRVDMLISELLWAGHPLGRDVAGTKETVRTISRESILNYFKGHYFPSNTVVTVTGAVDHEEVVAAVSQRMGGWEGQLKQMDYLYYEPKEIRRLRIETRAMEEVYLCLGLPGLSLFHPKRYTLDMLSTILGYGLSSRLFRQVRDRLGLVYSIGSFAEHFLDTGSFVISASVAPKNLAAVIGAVLEQLAHLKEKVPEWELSKGKEISRGHLLLRLEDSGEMANWIGAQEILAGRVLTIGQMIEHIEMITAEELQELAKQLLVGDRLSLAVVGPVSDNDRLDALLKI